MRFRPRYSLLTLLVFTALVAGGVKLWYGPHHVVDRMKYYEYEYSYTKNWDNSRIVEGPYIMRSYQPDGKTLYAIYIKYYRQGKSLPWRYELNSTETQHQYLGPPQLDFLRNYQMNSAEQQACKNTIEQEKQRFVAQLIATTDSLRESINGMQLE